MSVVNPLAPADPRKSVAVFASAGTGKTWLLVARILRLLLDGAKPDTILAITFTRKAAAEIRQRLTERLEEWLHLAGDDQALAESLRQIGVAEPENYLARARALFEIVQFADQGIRIATFHSFFQDLLKRFPLEAGIPAGFTIPQREETARLHQEAEDQLFEEATREPDGELAKSLRAVMKDVLNLSTLRSVLGKFREHILEWRAFAGDRTPEQLRAHLRDEVFLRGEEPDDFLIAQLGFQIPLHEMELWKLADLLMKSAASKKSHQAGAAAKLYRAMDEEEAGSLEQITRIHAALINPDTGGLRTSLPPTSKAAQERLGKKDTRKLNEGLSMWQITITEVFDHMLRRKSCELNGHWYDVFGHLADNYQRLKLSHGLLDYDDLLWFSNRLMSDGVEWVQYKLGQRFRHVLVDEFQDTDAMSWQTLQAFLRSLHEADEDHGTAFIVGDTKQSIYQWRRANPEIQAEADAYLRQHLRAGEPVPMDLSRRSSRVIIEVVNAAFGEDGLFPLPDFSPHRTDLTQWWGRVELLPLIPKADEEELPIPDPEQPLRDPLTEPRPERHSTRLEQMADQIAERIEAIVDQQVAIEERGGSTHAATYNDCMILVNRRTHVTQIENALSRRGIPFARQSRETLLKHLEVLDMQALLQLLLRPADDLHLAQVLRSPLYCVTDEELMELALADPVSGSWSERLENLAKRKDPAHPLRRADRDFRVWRERVDHIPTHDLLDRIYFETDALRRYLRAWPGERGERAVSNLVRFIELTLEFDSGRYPSTSAFVHFVEATRRGRMEGFDAPDTVTLKSAERAERVEILTVHAAKGLERPIVVYAELTKLREGGKAGDLLIDWPADQARPRRFLLRPRQDGMDSVSRQCLELIRGKRQAEDNNRTYVAFTRARQLLILCQYEELHRELAEKLFASAPGELALGDEPPTMAARPEAPPTAAPPVLDGLDRPMELAAVHLPSDLDDAAAEQGSVGRRRALERGRVVHAVIEMLQDGEPDPIWITRLAQRFNRDPGEDEFRRWVDEARRVVADPKLDPVFRPGPETRVYTEVPVLCRSGEDAGYGIIDRLLVAPDRTWVIDFKSHATADPQALDEAAGRYVQQMAEYARFMRAVYPERPVRCSLLFTRSRLLRDMPGG